MCQTEILLTNLQWLSCNTPLPDELKRGYSCRMIAGKIPDSAFDALSALPHLPQDKRPIGGGLDARINLFDSLIGGARQ